MNNTTTHPKGVGYPVLFIGVGLFGSIIAGMAILYHVRSRTHVHTIKDYIEEIQTSKIEYFYPYRYTLLFIVFTEFFLSFN